MNDDSIFVADVLVQGGVITYDIFNHLFYSETLICDVCLNPLIYSVLEYICFHSLYSPLFQFVFLSQVSQEVSDVCLRGEGRALSSDSKKRRKRRGLRKGERKDSYNEWKKCTLD